MATERRRAPDARVDVGGRGRCRRHPRSARSRRGRWAGPQGSRQGRKQVLPACARVGGPESHEVRAVLRPTRVCTVGGEQAEHGADGCGPLWVGTVGGGRGNLTAPGAARSRCPRSVGVAPLEASEGPGPPPGGNGRWGNESVCPCSEHALSAWARWVQRGSLVFTEHRGPLRVWPATIQWRTSSGTSAPAPGVDG